MPKSSLDQLDRFYAEDRSKWHQWLNQNHETSSGVWLIYHKKNSSKISVSYDDAVEEAIIFGWIDSKANKLDEERYMQVFTPRKPGSVWSRINKERANKLIMKGLMQPAGMKTIENAKIDGSWDFMNEIEDLIVPKDLKKALSLNEIALKNFEAFAKSRKKQILYWIASAKRDDTRNRRIKKVVESAIVSKTPF